MSNTSNMIATASNGNHDFRFLVKPSPGKRRTDLICSSQFSDIAFMEFISNHHLLVCFKGGANLSSLSLEVSGKTISQSNRVQDILDNNYKMISIRPYKWTEFFYKETSADSFIDSGNYERRNEHY